MTQVIGTADSVTQMLDVQSELALVTQQSHIAAAESAQELAGVVKQLTTTTRLELQGINDTATSLKQNMIADTGLYSSLLSPVIYGALKMMLKGAGV